MNPDSGSTPKTELRAASSEAAGPVIDKATQRPVRIIVFNDHPVFRSALSWKIGNDTGVEVVADSPSLYETLALVNADSDAPNIDAVVAELRIGDGNSEGVESIKTLTARIGDVPVIACSDLFSRSYVDRLREAGAATVLQKSGSAGRLVEAVHAAVTSTRTRATAPPTTVSRAA